MFSCKKFYLAAFMLWLIPFVGRFFIDNPDYSHFPQTTNTIMESMNTAYHQNDSFRLFSIIFRNNMIGCVINIMGGVLLSVPTICNLVYNGFMASDTFTMLHSNGISIWNIAKTTLPHSIELIGFWISGAIGFMISYRLVQMMRNKADIKMTSLRKLFFMCILVLIIILIAAFIEAYVSVNM